MLFIYLTVYEYNYMVGRTRPQAECGSGWRANRAGVYHVVVNNN